MQTKHLSLALEEACFIVTSVEISPDWRLSAQCRISEVFFPPLKLYKITSLQVTKASLSLQLCQLRFRLDRVPLDLQRVRKDGRVERVKGWRHSYWEGSGGGERCSFDGPLHTWLSSSGARTAMAVSFWISTLSDRCTFPCVASFVVRNLKYLNHLSEPFDTLCDCSWRIKNQDTFQFPIPFFLNSVLPKRKK